jgi:arylsulfatase A-like enzyme
MFCFRSGFRVVAFTLLAALALLTGITSGASPRQYNVLFIAVDDLRPELGCYGKTGIHSPNIDRLASSGIVFERAYCQQAVCSPSRTSLLTGLRPDTTRVYDLQTHFRLNLPDVVTLPQQFKLHGYHTQSLGKIYHGGLDDPRSWSAPSWHPSKATWHKPESLAALRAAKDKFSKDGSIRRNTVVQRDDSTGLVLKLQRKGRRALGPSWEDPDLSDSELSDGAIADQAIETLREIKDRPFFLAVGFLKPHLPFIAPKKYFDLYPPDAVRTADNPYPPSDVPAIALHNFGELRSYSDIPGKGPVSDDKARELVRAYYAATSFVDAQIGRVIDELDKLGLRDNTIIILWGDHGWQLGEHGLWCKHTNFEVAARVPMILSVPGRTPGLRSRALVEFVDIYPTLCELCRVPLPEGLEGLSMVPLLDNPDRPWKSGAFSQYPRGKVMGHSLRTDRYRYTEWTEPGQKAVGIELYDHEHDPAENVNLAGHPDQQQRIRALSKQLRAGWQAALPEQPRHAARDRTEGGSDRPDARPSILFAIADDWSYPHAGVYGDPVVKTPTFDRLAEQGVLFNNAYCAAPSCTPSRGAVLTGQAVHRLGAGGNLWSFLPDRYAVYPDLLEQAGYAVGYTRKGWGPGSLEGTQRTRNPAGPKYAEFGTFLEQVPPEKPFCFWFGSQDPHRSYEEGSGIKAGLDPEKVIVPPFLPDTPVVRSDMLDYYFEVQRFDREVGEMLSLLEKAGRADNTIVVMTSDNGMPFPRSKANLYDYGTHMPLVIRWPARVEGGRRVDAFVSFTDFAPTFLEAAGLRPLPEMTGRSLVPLLAGKSEGGRDCVFVERERHANVRKGNLSYPCRAIRTRDYLYIRNFRPDRWPAGDPEHFHSVGAFGDIDGSPTKDVVLRGQTEPALQYYFELACAKRPAEELYDLEKDPAEIHNVADGPGYADTKGRLRERLDTWMKATEDPRATSDDDRWDHYPYFGRGVPKPARKK